MFKPFTTLLAAGAMAWMSAAGAAEIKELPWGTSAVGSAGHKALVVLADVINKEMPKYRVTVQPTPGAIVSVKGYATVGVRWARYEANSFASDTEKVWLYVETRF